MQIHDYIHHRDRQHTTVGTEMSLMILQNQHESDI